MFIRKDIANFELPNFLDPKKLSISTSDILKNAYISSISDKTTSLQQI